MREGLLLLATAMLIIMALGCKELSVTKDAGSVITTRTPTATPTPTPTPTRRADTRADADADADSNADANADANTFTRARHLPAESSHPECSYKQAANT